MDISNHEERCLGCYSLRERNSDDWYYCPHSWTWFCHSCLKTYLSVAIQAKDILSNHRIRCPCSKTCIESFQESEIIQFHKDDSQLLEAFQRFAKIIEVESNPKLFWCPTPDCQTPIEKIPGVSRIHCPNCRQSVCNHCFQIHSKLFLCTMIPNATYTRLRWLSKSSCKKCPCCKVIIEKNEGCKHMTCTRCSHQFCWDCESSWSMGCTSKLYCRICYVLASKKWGDNRLKRRVTQVVGVPLAVPLIFTAAGLVVAGAGLAGASLIAGGVLASPYILYKTLKIHRVNTRLDPYLGMNELLCRSSVKVILPWGKDTPRYRKILEKWGQAGLCNDPRFPLVSSTQSLSSSLDVDPIDSSSTLDQQYRPTQLPVRLLGFTPSQGRRIGEDCFMIYPSTMIPISRRSDDSDAHSTRPLEFPSLVPPFYDFPYPLPPHLDEVATPTFDPILRVTQYPLIYFVPRDCAHLDILALSSSSNNEPHNAIPLIFSNPDPDFDHPHHHHFDIPLDLPPSLRLESESEGNSIESESHIDLPSIGEDDQQQSDQRRDRFQSTDEMICYDHNVSMKRDDIKGEEHLKEKEKGKEKDNDECEEKKEEEDMKVETESISPQVVSPSSSPIPSIEIEIELDSDLKIEVEDDEDETRLEEHVEDSISPHSHLSPLILPPSPPTSPSSSVHSLYLIRNHSMDPIGEREGEGEGEGMEGEGIEGIWMQDESPPMSEWREEDGMVIIKLDNLPFSLISLSHYYDSSSVSPLIEPIIDLPSSSSSSSSSSLSQEDHSQFESQLLITREREREREREIEFREIDRQYMRICRSYFAQNVLNPLQHYLRQHLY